MKTVIKNIYDKISELSDLKLQKKLWLNENNNTGLISSYTEMMCTLFDNYNFDDFVNRESTKIGLSSKTIIELKNLRHFLNEYREKESDKEILNDPEWGKVVNQAKKVITHWDKENISLE